MHNLTFLLLVFFYGFICLIWLTTHISYFKMYSESVSKINQLTVNNTIIMLFYWIFCCCFFEIYIPIKLRSVF